MQSDVRRTDHTATAVSDPDTHRAAGPVHTREIDLAADDLVDGVFA
jgi:hypothetical protein